MESNFNKKNQEENVETTKPQSTSWLLELGIQSWQAELVLSGLLITILFQLPDLFIRWVEPSIVQSSEFEFGFLRLASIYLLLGINCLILLFGIHLLLRGIWIALLGLHSVYPQGIDIDSKNGMGKQYWQKTKEQYPNLTEYNVELDANCSILFSLATLCIILYSSMSLCVLIFYQCMQFSMSVFPIIADNVKFIAIGLVSLLAVTSLLAQYLAKKYPDNQKILKIITGYGLAVGTIFSLYVFRKPSGYISSILSSNVKSKSYIFVIIIAGGVLAVVCFKQLGKIDAFTYFDTERYFTFNNKPHQILTLNYENLIEKEALIYTPIIQSDIVTDNFIKVFIPTIERETEHIALKTYSFAEKLKVSRSQREAVDVENLQAYKQFNRIFINNVEYPNLDYQYHWHPKADDKGLLVYIPTDSCKIGRNILEIRKNYFSKDSVQKIVKIPFFFERKS